MKCSYTNDIQELKLQDIALIKRMLDEHNCDPFSEARAPVERDATWLRGFMMAVIREPWIHLGVMSAASRGLGPLWARMRHGCVDP